MKKKPITSGNMTRNQGHGLNVVFLVVGGTDLAEKMSETGVGKLLEGSPLRIALRILSFWLLSSSLSPGQVHLSLQTLLSWIWAMLVANAPMPLADNVV